MSLVRTIVPIIFRRFLSTNKFAPQGIQECPVAFTSPPDFTFPQGLQGDLLSGGENDAIYQLWLQNCKMHGYDDCEERLQELLTSSKISSTTK